MIADDWYYEELGLDQVGQGIPCPDFRFIDAAFTDVDGTLQATLPEYQVGDLLVAGWRTPSTSDPPTGWSSQLATQASGLGVTNFGLSYRIADGTEGSTVTLPTGADGDIAVVACWRISGDISGATWLTEIEILGAPFYDGGYLSGESVNSIASEAAVAWPSSDQFAATTLIDPAAGYLIDTFSIAFVEDPLPAYHWNHETERVQSQVVNGWRAIVAEGLRDTTSGTPAPSIELEETHTGIYHGWLTFLCTGSLPPPDICAFDPANLINDNFADALEITIAGGTGDFGGSGYPHTPTDGETLLGATKEAGEPNHMGDAGGHSIWFKFVADTTGPWFVYAATQESDDAATSPLVAVYTGSDVASLTEVSYSTPPASDSFAGTCGLAWETYGEITSLTSGTTYYVAVDGAGGIPLKAVYVQVGTL